MINVWFPLELLIKMNPRELKVWYTFNHYIINKDIWHVLVLLINTLFAFKQTQKSSRLYYITTIQSNGKYIWMFNL